MTRRAAPTQYRVSVEDVHAVVREHAVEWGATATYVVCFPEAERQSPYVEVVIRDGLWLPTGKELVRVRWPLSARDIGQWPANLLHALMSAYDALRNDPWLWPEEKRRQAVEE